MVDPNNTIATTLYDPAGRVLASEDALGNRATHIYDVAGQTIGLVDARGNRTTSGFDASGRHTRLQDPLARLITLGYDAAGRQLFRLDARRNRITYVYDNADRLTGRRYSDGTRVTLGYDAASRLIQMQDSTGRSTWSYDNANQVRTATNSANLRTTSAYDSAGRRTLLVEPGGGRFTYAYDSASRLDHLTNPEGQRTSFGYDKADRLVLLRLANSVRTSYLYDDADRTVRLLSLLAPSTLLSGFTYTYDLAGTPIRVVELSGDTVTWSYDKTYQLLGERRSGPQGYAVTYTYDAAGNRLTARDSGSATTYTYDAANQLLTARRLSATTTYAYDNSGNTSAATAPGNARTTFTWDVENRRTSTQLPTGVRNTFAYDGYSRSVRKDDSAGTTMFLWDADNIFLATDQNNATQVVYTLALAAYGNLVSQRQSNATQYFLFDRVGSTDRLTDGNGAVTDTYVYRAFGSLQAATGSTTNAFRYIGRAGYYFLSDLGQYYVRARHYDPTLGRFLSADPRIPPGYASGSYAYVGNSPVNGTDPSGYDCPGCDLPWWLLGEQANSSECVLACCAVHDKCYYDRHCTFTSWAFYAKVSACQFGTITKEELRCAPCNNNVSACIAACGTGNHMKGKDLYFCAKTGKFITIGKPSPPKTFPNIEAAKRACCT